MKNFNLLNKKGFGLVPVMIASFVGLIVIGGLIEAMMTVINSQKSASIRDEAELVNEQIALVLSHEGSCQAAMNAFGASIVPTGTGPIKMQMKLTDVVRTIQAGDPVSPDLAVGAVTVTDTGAAPVAFAMPAPFGTVNHYVVDVQLQLKKINSSLYPPQHKPRSIRLQVMVDAANTIKGCVSENDDVRTCTQRGGIWNPLETSGNRCLAFNYCEWGGSYSTAPNGYFKNQLTNNYSCPDATYTAVQSGTIATAQMSGKTDVVNSVAPIMTCVRCGAHIPITPQPAPPASVPSGLASDITDYTDSSDSNYSSAACIAAHGGSCPYPSP